MSAIQSSGKLEMFAGPMLSGKTARLILRLEQFQAIGRQVQIFTSTKFNQSKNEIRSRTGLAIAAKPIEKPRDIMSLLDVNTTVIGIDECHFFDNSIVTISNKLASLGKYVIVAGVDMDFRRMPFRSVALLLAISEDITKLTSLCSVCGEPASYTQRLTRGKPSKPSESSLKSGKDTVYTPRCRIHHIVPGKPNLGSEQYFKK